VFKSPLFKEIVWVVVGRSIGCLKIAENFWFFIFCAHNKQWWIAK